MDSRGISVSKRLLHLGNQARPNKRYSFFGSTLKALSQTCITKKEEDQSFGCKAPRRIGGSSSSIRGPLIG
jgi:hypothetical protein